MGYLFLVLAEGATDGERNHNRGHLLEQFVAEILGRSGYEKPTEVNAVAVRQTGVEIDVRTRHKIHPHTVIVECKLRSERRAPSSELMTFVGKLQLVRLEDSQGTMGIFVAIPGLTKDGEEAARKIAARDDLFQYWSADVIASKLREQSMLPGLPAEASVLEPAIIVSRCGLHTAWKEVDGRGRIVVRVVGVGCAVPDDVVRWLQEHPYCESARIESLPPAAPGVLPVEADQSPFVRYVRDATKSISVRGLHAASGRAHAFELRDMLVWPAAVVDSHRVGAGDSPVGTASMPVVDLLQERCLCLTGDPGSGKSTIIQAHANQLAYAWLSATAEGRSSLPIPFIVRLPELADYMAAHSLPFRTPSVIPDFIALSTQDYGWPLNADSTRRLAGDGRLAILFDGLDEVSGIAARTEVAGLIARAALAFPDCQFLVTSRDIAQGGLRALDGFLRARLVPFDLERVGAYVDNWCRCVFAQDPASGMTWRNQLLGAIKEQASIQALATNPVMLTALAVIHWNERKLPVRRAELYESILKWLGTAREAKPGRIPADKCLRIMETLALAMQLREQRTTTVSRRGAAECIVHHFVDVMSDDRLEQAISFLDDEETDSGIVVGRGSDVRFWHLSFQEYLAARAIAGMTEAEQEAVLKQDAYLRSPDWQEVFVLLAGVLHRQGESKLDVLLTLLSDSVDGLPAAEDRAAVVGLIGSILSSLTGSGYRLPEAGRRVVESAEYLFGQELSPQRRANLGDAIGIAGVAEDAWRAPRASWVLVESGTYRIGAQNALPEEPNFDREAHVGESPVLHQAVDAFEIQRYPVTVEAYREFVEDDGYGDEQWWDGGVLGLWQCPADWARQLRHQLRPVVGVSWYEAAAYARWLGHGTRLPSEIEWEAAARGVEARRHPWGNGEVTDQHANYANLVGRPTVVGSFPPGDTPSGVGDLAGNVWEWCDDWYEETAYELIADCRKSPTTGKFKSLRGGSFSFHARFIRSARRLWDKPHVQHGNVGFRLVREPQP